MIARKRIFLTGGSGFIGKNILKSFLKDKYEWLSPSHRELNLADTKQVDNFFKKNKIDFVIHSAAKLGDRNSKNRDDIFYTNTRIFVNLARHADEVERMIVLGSGAIYDLENCGPRMREDFFGVHVPIDEYGFSKYVCEKIIASSDNIVDLRLFGVFGKYEDYTIRFISNMMCKCIFDLPLTMKQDRRFDFLYVNDLMPILDHFIQNNFTEHAINVTPDETISLFDMANRILVLSGKDLPIIVKMPGQGREYSGDNTKLKQELGIFRFTPFENSLNELYQWYLGQTDKIDREALLNDKW